MLSDFESFFYDQSETDSVRHLHAKGEKWREAARRRRRGVEGVGQGEGQSAALHNKDLGIIVRILHTQTGYYLFLHMSFQPIPQDTQAEGGCRTPSRVRVNGSAFYLSP